MQPQKDLAAAAAVAGNDVDAGEDGDFVVLRENREARIPEAIFTDIRQDLETNQVHRPSSSRLMKVSALVGEAWRRWSDLTDAAIKGPQTFREALQKTTSQASLTSPQLKDPHNSQNILHFVLELDDSQITKIVLEFATCELIEHKFDVEVMKITGKKTAFHQVVEKNNIDILKVLLGKISREKRVAILNDETPVEIKGQRPRTFPCLHLAAYYGLTEIVECIIDEGVDVNHLNAKNDTALLWATRWRHIETVRSMLARGAKADLENDKGSTALYWAVRYGHSDVVEVLAREGRADVNKQRKLGLVAPIVLASALGLSETLSILLKYRANPNTVIRGNERPIHHAAKEGHSTIIDLLVASGAEVDAADVRGDTALLLAAKYGSAKALQALLKHGAVLDHKNLLGENVWKFAISGSNDVILKLLVGHQRRVDTESGVEDSPNNLSPSADGISSLLFLAAAAGNISTMNLLFKMKVDGSVTDENGNTYLHIAAINNQPRIIEEFHKMVSIDSTNGEGNTALHEACTRGHHDVIVSLINMKAMANIRNTKGETPLHLAACCRLIQPNTVSILMDFVIKTHSWECLNMQDHNRNNALHIAARHARPEVLWEFRFVSLKAQDKHRNTVLHNAIRSNVPEVLDKMLDIFEAMKRDCDINHKNVNGETPLFLAAREGLLEGVKRLMQLGADISVCNNKGNSALHMLTFLTVMRPGQCDLFLEVIVAILERVPLHYSTWQNLKRTDQDFLFIRRRAILKLVTDLPNNSGLTVLDIACMVGASEVVKLLVSLEDVMAFKDNLIMRYDITNLIPRTNGSLGVSLQSNKVVPRLSCLDRLLVNGRALPQNVAKVLDIQPFHDIEGAYGRVANWSFAVLMILHILYMSLLSWSGLAALNDSRLRPGERTTNGYTLVTYIIVPLEPLAIIIYITYKLIILCCSGEMSIKRKLRQRDYALKTSLAFFISLAYSIFVVSWIIMYATNYQHMDIFLSIALCIGWMLSIVLTRGFKTINYFWRLIKIIIVRNVFKFLVIYFFVLLSFSFAFHAMFQVSQDVVNLYPDPFYTIFLMFNMMIGMQYVFDDDSVNNVLRNDGKTSVFLKVLYILYMILATIVLLNILIAMMNDSYQEILERQKVTWRIESVTLGVEVEQSMPWTFPLFSKVKIIHGHICPSDQKDNILRWYIESSSPADEDSKEAILDLKLKMGLIDASMSEQSHSMRSSIDEIQSTEC